MSTLDVEDLLRRTYADVAARTVAAPPSDTTVVPLRIRQSGHARRWSMLVAAAAAIVLVVATAVALRRTSEDGPAGVDESTFVHALPGYLPGAGGGASFNAPTLPLRSITSSPDRRRDRLRRATRRRSP